MFTHEDLAVDACVTILGGCPAEYLICGKQVEIHFGSRQDGFHFAFDARALDKLLTLGAEALAELRVAECQPT